MEGSYEDWKQVAGYFDGDGSTDLKIGKRVIFMKFTFTDNYEPQLRAVDKFLKHQRIETERISSTQNGASRLGVGRYEGTREMAVEMLPHVFKKRTELQAVLDYYDNRITGTQLIEVMNRSVRIRNRTGKIRMADVPFTREEGQELDKVEKGNNAREMGLKNQLLSDDVLEQIRLDIISGRATNGELAKKYGVNPSTISRAVFGRGPRR